MRPIPTVSFCLIEGSFSSGASPHAYDVRQLKFSLLRLYAGTWDTPVSSGDTHDLSTRTLSILGLGDIGLHLAHLVHTFPMRAGYYSPRHVGDAESVEVLCREADALSIHVPLRPDSPSRGKERIPSVDAREHHCQHREGKGRGR